MPRRRMYRLSKNATTCIGLEYVAYPGTGLTSMPNVLSRQQPINRFAYRILPFKMYGHPTLATKAGAILQKAIMPFGVDGGTKSSAADSIIT